MYDAAPFIDRAPRVPGFHDVRCRITWAPRTSAGPPADFAVGDYLDADSPDGTVSLGCGIESALTDLGMEQPADDVFAVTTHTPVGKFSANSRPTLMLPLRCREDPRK